MVLKVCRFLTLTLVITFACLEADCKPTVWIIDGNQPILYSKPRFNSNLENQRYVYTQNYVPQKRFWGLSSRWGSKTPKDIKRREDHTPDQHDYEKTMYAMPMGLMI